MTYDQAEFLITAVGLVEAAIWAVAAGVWANAVLSALFELVKLGRVIWAARGSDERRRLREALALEQAARRGAA